MRPDLAVFGAWHRAAAYLPHRQLSAADFIEFGSMPEPNSGCWLFFRGSLKTQEYGHVSIYFNGRRWAAHRLSWTAHRGPIPNNKSVLHKCDVPCCVNPDHLFLGTHLENMADMKTKRRSCWGERNGNAILTPNDVVAILASPQSQEKIAQQFGISQTQVSRIKRKMRWRGVDAR